MSKIATQLARDPRLVQLPNGTTMTSARALSAGYTVQPATSRRMTDVGLETEAARYLAEVTALPEAEERPITAERIGKAYSYASLPVDRAAGILRGLPSEIDEMRERIEAKRVESAVATEDPRVRRKVELRVASLSTFASFDDAARKECSQLNYALATAREARIPVKTALARIGIDAARFV